MENVTAGYEGKVVLSRLEFRIDQDDRIALLGQNGEGKSTLAKLISDRLKPMSGQLFRSSKLRIGYFAQHQVDELYVDETPLEHLHRLRPTKTPVQIRAILAGFGIGAEQANTIVGRLSGGQKARLSLLIATLDAPHLLILDEPANHLDIESREALVEALTAYSGAVVLVSHDMHLLSLVADRLWLVKGGHVRPYEGDLDAYRAFLLSGDKGKKKRGNDSPKPKPKHVSRDEILAMKAEVRKCELRLEKLSNIRDKLSKKLADPKLYKDTRSGELETWNRKYVEVMEALERAEAIWLTVEEKLEAAQNMKPLSH